MEIIFNNRKQEIDDDISVQMAVAAWFGDKQKGIAVAVNDTIIPKAQWEKYLLQPSDKVIVIKATQGG